MRAILAALSLCVPLILCAANAEGAPRSKVKIVPTAEFDRHHTNGPWATAPSQSSGFLTKQGGAAKRSERQPRSVSRPRHQRRDDLRRPVSFASNIVAPAHYIAGRLVCAINVNAALAERGIQGTGSPRAKSFLGWGSSSGPVPGAVAVYNRGRNRMSGHVAIVSRVEGGKVYVLNPTRRGWIEHVYRKPAIAYRVASL